MITADFHTHSTFSTDGKSSLEDMITTAIKNNLKIYCITEHMDYQNHNYMVQEFLDEFNITDSENAKSLFHCDTEAYFNAFMKLKEKYNNLIDLRFGMELGLQSDLGDYYDTYTTSYPFDFLIGSLHEAGGIDPYYKAFLGDKTANEAYSFYFQQLFKSMKACTRSIDVLGHLDYALRYHRPENFVFSYSDYQEDLDAILDYIIANKIGLEFNTGSLAYFSDDKLPILQILKHYRNKGGEIITIGSDAHHTKDIARYFDLANKLLLDCGFKYYTVFKNRTPKMLPL